MMLEFLQLENTNILFVFKERQMTSECHIILDIFARNYMYQPN